MSAVQDQTLTMHRIIQWHRGGLWPREVYVLGVLSCLVWKGGLT